MDFTCPACASTFVLKKAPSGRPLWCPYCGEKIVPGGPSDTKPPAESPLASTLIGMPSVIPAIGGAERAAAEKAAAEKVAAEKVAAEKVAAEKVAAEKVAARPPPPHLSKKAARRAERRAAAEAKSGGASGPQKPPPRPPKPGSIAEQAGAGLGAREAVILDEVIPPGAPANALSGEGPSAAEASALARESTSVSMSRVAEPPARESAPAEARREVPHDVVVAARPTQSASESDGTDDPTRSSATLGRIKPVRPTPPPIVAPGARPSAAVTVEPAAQSAVPVVGDAAANESLPKVPVPADVAGDAAAMAGPATAGVVVQEDRFFESEAGAAPAVDADVADDIEPPHHASNRPFLYISVIVALGVGVFILYLVFGRDRAPTAPKRLAAAKSSTTAAARTPVAPVAPVAPAPVPPLPPLPALALDAGAQSPRAPDAGLATAPLDAGVTPSIAAAAVDAGAPLVVAEAPAVDEARDPAVVPSPREEEADDARPERRPPRRATPRAPEPTEAPKPPEPEPTPAPPEPPPPPPPPPPEPKPKPKPSGDRALAKKRYDAGQALLLQGQFAGAVQEFRESLRADRRFADAHRGLGVAYSAMQRKKDAVRHYEAYLRMRPKAPDRETVKEALQDLR